MSFFDEGILTGQNEFTHNRFHSQSQNFRENLEKHLKQTNRSKLLNNLCIFTFWEQSNYPRIDPREINSMYIKVCKNSH